MEIKINSDIIESAFEGKLYKDMEEPVLEREYYILPTNQMGIELHIFERPDGCYNMYIADEIIEKITQRREEAFVMKLEFAEELQLFYKLVYKMDFEV